MILLALFACQGPADTGQITYPTEGVAVGGIGEVGVEIRVRLPVFPEPLEAEPDPGTPLSLRYVPSSNGTTLEPLAQAG